MKQFYQDYKNYCTLLFLLIINSHSFAQTGWSIDQTFNKRIAKTDDYFFRISRRTDGKFLFCTNNDKTKLKMMNADGTISTTFEVPTTGNIIAITQATGDKTYVGGDFTNMMNVFAPKIARINADGTRDINFLPDTSTQNVYALQEQTDGKLLVGRDGSIQRLNDDGTLDTTFTTVTTNGIVYSFAILPNGKILAGGLFTTINGATKNRIVLLNSNGTVDTSFVVGTGFNSDVHIVRVASDGSFFVGGKFTTYKGTTINRIAKLSNTGTLDANFHASNTGFDNDVWTIEFLNDNKPLLGGLFTTYKGLPNNSVLKLNLDGTVDTSFDTGIAQSNGIVYKIIVNSANDVFLSGTFMKYKDTYTNQAFIANYDGSINTSFHLDERFCVPGTSLSYFFKSTLYTNQHKYATVVQNDGKIILANVYFENKFYTLMRLNVDGTRDITFNFVETNNIKDIVNIIIRPNGKIICSATTGNTGISDGNINLKGLFQLNIDGSIDTSFDTGIITVPTLCNLFIGLQSDGKVILFSDWDFNYKGFQASSGAIRILENGNIDLSFQNVSGNFRDNNTPAARPVPIEIIILPNNKILLYTYDICQIGYGNNPPTTIPIASSRRYSIVTLNENGTLLNRFENLNLWNNDNSGNAFINKIIVDNNSLIITGKFTQVNGITQRSIAKIDFDGNLISSFGSPILPTIQTFNNAIVTDIVKHNNKYYYSTFTNLPPWSSLNPYIEPFNDCDINILRCNEDGTLDTSFSTIILDRNNNLNVFRPRNAWFNFNETNKMVVFGQYNSINNQPNIGLSRIIIDESLSTSNNEFSENNIKCYPNPTNSILNISTQNETINQINVYDLLGRLLKTQNGNNMSEQINIQELPNAIYILEINTEKAKQSIKVVKK